MCCSHPSLKNLERILYTCKKRKSRAHALRSHAHIKKCGLEIHVSLGNYVVPMLVEAECIQDAHQAFDRLLLQNEFSWNALIAGYVKCGMPHLALNLYHHMQTKDSIYPSGSTFVALLTACMNLKDLQTGEEIHSEVERIGLVRSDLILGSCLVDMYGKIGSFALAQEVFDELPDRDVVLWTMLITRYVEYGCAQEALKCFDRMQVESVLPDLVTFSSSFKACGGVGDTKRAQELHANIAGMEPFERNIFFGSALVDMYAKCGLMAMAETVFDNVQLHNVVIWTTLIAGYVEHGCCEDAIKCFHKMQLEGVGLDDVTIVCILRACGASSAEEEGAEIHAEIARSGWLEGSHSVGNALVHMYAEFGSLTKAQEVFDDLPRRDIDSWNALIEGYTEHGYADEAVKCFEQMELEYISPNAATFIYISKAYISILAMDKAKEMLAMIEREHWLEQDAFLGSALIDAYAQCGMVKKARQVFDNLLARNVVTWNALIGGYADNGCFNKSLDCFDQMQLEGVFPDAVTFICCLKSCESIGRVEQVEYLHTQIERLGLLDRDFVGNTLVHVYAKCGSLNKAQLAFDSLSDPNVVSWTALIAGHAEHGHGEGALIVLERMQGKCIPPDVFTCIHSVKACGEFGNIGKGEEIHAEIERQGLLEGNLAVGNSLLDMYINCGFLAKAQEVFDNLSFRDIVTWNTLIAAYAEHGCGKEAMKLYEQMQLQGFSPDAITLVCSLKACGSIGAKCKGWEIQAEIERRGLILKDPFVGSTLVDMYAKWGLLEKAQHMFDILPMRDVVSWNALMTGYARFGKGEHVFWFFDRMIGDGTKPDPVTFVVILSTCRRTGLLTKSQTYFEAMTKDYGISPTSKHHNCMVNLLSHAGQLDKAVLLIKKLPACPDLEVWHTFLSACRDWGSLYFGKQAFEDAVCLDEKDAVAYIMMSHIYASADQLGERNNPKNFERLC